jgi:hypothetical protein
VNEQYRAAHEEAGKRFLASPFKCYQRHIREVWAELEPRVVITSLKGAVVEQIPNAAAKDLISRYEWIAAHRGEKYAMGAGTKFSYGLKLDGELLGVACFNTGGGPEPRRICQDIDVAKRTMCLCRGACVPYAPKDAGSFLVRHACRLAHREHGYEVFFAYSDSDAGEIGTIYQAVGWKYLGAGVGRAKDKHGKSYHTDFIKDGVRVTTHSVYKMAVRYGWTEALGITKRDFVRSLGYKDVLTPDRAKWVWFEGPNKIALTATCRFPFLPYPKRGALDVPED